MHETRQAGGLIAQENDAPRLREWQTGLDGARVESHLAQDSAIGLVLRIQDRDFRKKARAPTDGQDAAALGLSYCSEPRLELLDGRLQQSQAGPFCVLFLDAQQLLGVGVYQFEEGADVQGRAAA